MSQPKINLGVSSESRPRSLISRRFSNKASAPLNHQPAQLPYIDEVKSQLTSGGFRLEVSACPCSETSGFVISEVDRYGLPLTFVVCASCGTLRIDPYLDSASLEDFYTRFFQQMYARVTDVEGYFLRQQKYGERIFALVRSWLKPGSRVYEVGCGAGGALAVFQRNGYKVAGCDYSAELVTAGAERGVNLYFGSLKSIATGSRDAKADLIYLNHVFEHMNDPAGFLEECRLQLAAKGRIIITVPDVSRIDSFMWPAGDLLPFLHIAHKYNFSMEGLRRLGKRTGYQVRQLRPDPRIQTPHSHMPELWVELSVAPGAIDHETAPAQTQGSYGSEMLQYLKLTEKRYSMGLCRGQLLQKLNAGRNIIGSNLSRLRRVTPAKLISKLKA
jgi:SAM-dependent methyltransferase